MLLPLEVEDAVDEPPCGVAVEVSDVTLCASLQGTDSKVIQPRGFTMRPLNTRPSFTCVASISSTTVTSLPASSRPTSGEAWATPMVTAVLSSVTV
eukprot:CAMPEP_0172692254 /NCGR_PEP_ID=MMETSP1074-20121228/25117_1 /TAXON_ID=2916 /ORGANISM="Ceratium fusus, Strain PA161109" /LENGTH=95 /DNA_ID=CAMNT_0013512421 /DNA_START=634 /DNA_END=921 /DNA_ORIENTATION=+